MSAEICPDCGRTKAAAWLPANPVGPADGDCFGQDRRSCREHSIVRLRAELAVVRRERDYLLQFADPKEVAQMRRELAAEWEWQGASSLEEENTRLRKTIEALRSRQTGLLRGREELAQVLRDRTR